MVTPPTTPPTRRRQRGRDAHSRSSPKIVAAGRATLPLCTSIRWLFGKHNLGFHIRVCDVWALTELGFYLHP